MCIPCNKKQTNYSPALEFAYKYSLGRCVRETSYINPVARERLCEDCFAGEPIAYKLNFITLKDRHYASVGTRLPRLQCIICNRYLAELRLLAECSFCEDLFFKYIQDLFINEEDFYDQPNPVLLRSAP